MTFVLCAHRLYGSLLYAKALNSAYGANIVLLRTTDDPISKGSGTDFIKVVKVGPQRRKADRGPVYVNGLRTLIMSSGVPFKPTIVLVSNGKGAHSLWWRRWSALSPQMYM